MEEGSPTAGRELRGVPAPRPRHRLPPQGRGAERAKVQVRRGYAARYLNLRPAARGLQPAAGRGQGRQVSWPAGWGTGRQRDGGRQADRPRGRLGTERRRSARPWDS